MPNVMRCPRCASHGKDTRGNNLALYTDHKYCYACGYMEHDRSITTMHNKLMGTYVQGTDTQSPPDLSSDLFTYSLPRDVRVWIDQYGITNEEILRHNICYDIDRNLLVCPVYDGDRLVAYSGRYFGTDKSHPRYITHKYKKSFFKFFKSERETPVVVLTEDFISALKVGRQYNAIPLLGATVPSSLVLSLIGLCPVLRIWLDRDKADEAIKIAARARQYIDNTATIITEHDPKDYTNEEIKEYVNESTRGT